MSFRLPLFLLLARNMDHNFLLKEKFENVTKIITLSAARSSESCRTEATVTFTGVSSLTSAFHITSIIATRTLIKKQKKSQDDNLVMRTMAALFLCLF